MKTTEQLASKFLRALESAPKESNQWSAKSAQQICERLKFSNKEFQNVMDYAFHGKLIEMTKKTDGFMRVRLGQNANGWLDKNTEPLTFDRRFMIYGLFVTVALSAIALLWQLVLRAEDQTQTLNQQEERSPTRR
jgi:hypothetical protein